jgi:SPP1 family predicted phage head-tail adaptor
MAKTLEAGQLRHRLTFQTGTSTNGDALTWTDALTVWGSVEPLTGSWLMESLQANSKISGIVRVRYNSSITSSMRIKFSSRYLRIDSIINPQEQNEQLQIMYSEWLD